VTPPAIRRATFVRCDLCGHEYISGGVVPPVEVCFMCSALDRGSEYFTLDGATCTCGCADGRDDAGRPAWYRALGPTAPDPIAPAR
jgi:hypothetical protein